MESFYLTDAGKVRDHNEDSVIITKNEAGEYLMAIADGMGGHSAGEVASSIAISHLGKHFKETFLNMSKIDAVNWIRDCVNEINSLIFLTLSAQREFSGIGNTSGGLPVVEIKLYLCGRESKFNCINRHEQDCISDWRDKWHRRGLRAQIGYNWL